MSRCLSELGASITWCSSAAQVAERWRRERWDSLRLLTPNWMTRLPGFAYTGPDPDGFMHATEVVTFLDRYADGRTRAGGDRRRRGLAECVGRPLRGRDRARHLAGASGRRSPPGTATPRSCRPWPPRRRRGSCSSCPASIDVPRQLPPGGVLVVGASASGLQIADELARAGRDVTIAAGQHTRVPRLYRGRDLFRWLDRIGLLRAAASDVYDLGVSRAQPSLQLVGPADA